MMKNLLLVSPLPPPIGGITSWTVEYMNQMIELGYTPALVNTTVTGKRLNNNAKINLFDELVRLRRIKKNINEVLRDGEVNVIHYNASCFIFGLIRDYYVLRPFFKKNAIIYHCHCNLETNVNNTVARIFFSLIAKNSDCVLTLNKKSLEFAQRYTSRTKVIPNFIHQVFVDSVNVKTELKNIAFVGRVSPPKGIYELIIAAKKIGDVNFHIIGPDDDHILEKKLGKNIVIHGAQPHEKVIELLKTMDAIILPSYSEGFPLVILEGMACGLPIIATAVGSIPDMIEKQGGVIIPDHDSAAILNAVESIKSVEIRQRMADFNLNKVKSNYLSKCVLSNLIDIYHSIV